MSALATTARAPGHADSRAGRSAPLLPRQWCDPGSVGPVKSFGHGARLRGVPDGQRVSGTVVFHTAARHQLAVRYSMSSSPLPSEAASDLTQAGHEVRPLANAGRAGWWPSVDDNHPRHALATRPAMNLTIVLV